MALSIFFLFLFISPSFSAYTAPITKHHIQSTPFYTLKLHLKTPLQPTDLLLHVGATFTTVDCTRNYTSTTFHPLPCNSSLCHYLQLSTQPNTTTTTTDCNITTGAGGNCVILPHNSFAHVDSLALPTTNGKNPGQLGVFHEFVFTCSDESTRLLQGHAKKELTGLAGFGFSKYSLPAQVSTGSSVFALCLSGSPSAPGVAFFDLVKPYYFFPGIDISEHLNYTPISTHPVAIGNIKSNARRYEDPYFIGVKSININGKPIMINQKLITIGETKISTTNPYTVLERSIFTAFIEGFTNESSIMKLKLREPIKPFRICYEANELTETHLGPNVPEIDLVMENDVIWRVLGKNSMVRIVEEGLDVWCLAVVDGGVRPTSSMVIGGHQLEDNLLQFDLGKKRLGFSSSLLQQKTMCANFNFTTI